MDQFRTMTWGEVSDQADNLFNVWMGGREREWAEMSWTCLSEEGLTTYLNETGKALVYIRLTVLGVMYREFCAEAWDEWNEPDIGLWLDEMNVGPFRIAQLVGKGFQS